MCVVWGVGVGLCPPGKQDLFPFVKWRKTWRFTHTSKSLTTKKQRLFDSGMNLFSRRKKKIQHDNDLVMTVFARTEQIIFILEYWSYIHKMF